MDSREFFYGKIRETSRDFSREVREFWPLGIKIPDREAPFGASRSGARVWGQNIEFFDFIEKFDRDLAWL